MRTLFAFSLFFFVALMVHGQDMQDTAWAGSLLKEANILINARKYEEALAKLDTAGKIYLETMGNKSADYGNVVHLTGIAFLNQNKLDTSAIIFKKAIEIRKEAPEFSYIDLASSFHYLGVCYNRRGDYHYALEYLYKALEIRRDKLGSDHTHTAFTLNEIGIVHKNLGNYDQAIEFYENSLDIVQKKMGTDHPNVATALNNIAIIYRIKGDFGHAIEYYKRSLAIREKRLGQGHPEVATSLANISNLYFEKGEYDSAITYSQKSLEIRLRVYGSEHYDVAISFLTLGNISLQLNKFDQSIAYYQKSLNIFQNTLGNDHPDVATTLQGLGEANMKKGNYDLSLIFLKKSLEIKQKRLGPDHPDVAAIYSVMGNVYRAKDDFNQSIEYTQKAFDIFEKKYGITHSGIGIMMYNFAADYLYKGQYHKAIKYANKAYDIIHLTLGPEHPTFAACIDLLGGIYSSLEDYDKSVSYIQKAIEIKQKILAPDDYDLMISFNNLGIAFCDKGDFVRGHEYKKRALDIVQRKFGAEHPDIKSLLSNLGLSYLDMGNYDLAIDCFQKSLQSSKNDSKLKTIPIANSLKGMGTVYRYKGIVDSAILYYKMALDVQLDIIGPIHPDFAQTYYLLGSVYLEKGSAHKALDYFNQSLTANNYSDANIMSGLSVIGSVSIKDKIGRSYRALYHLTKDKNYIFKSYKDYQIARQIMRNHQGQNFSRDESFAGNIHVVYENNILTDLAAGEITDSLYYFNDAFTASEESRAFSLYGSLRESDALHFANIPDSLLQREYDLRVEIAYYEKKRFAEEIEKKKPLTDSTLLAINSKLFDLKRAYEALKDTFEHQYPDYYRLKYDLRVETVDSVQKDLLHPDQALLEYFVGDSSIFIFLVKKDDYRVFEVKKDFPLEDWVKQLRHGIYGYHTAPNRTDALRDSAIDDYIESATALYQKLLAPVDSLLPRRLVIVPDGALGYIPFEALLTARPERKDRFHTYPYFGREKGRERSVSYCYSATLLREMTDKRHRRKPSKMLGAFAPYYDGDTSVLTGLDDLFTFRSVAPGDLEPLKFSGAEVAAAQKLLGGDVFTDTSATEERFNRVAGDYRILHLSTHGKADDRSGDYSYLVFNPRKDSLENELLYCRDIYNLSLNADMVVLSACETGIGELKRGEGIISLARAFAYAGAKSIVTTLWSVDDARTKDFMVFFYRNLKEGMTKDEALAKARSDYFRKHKGPDAHPYFWAGFVGIGDMGAIRD